MKIEILGTGCPKCKELESNTKKVLEELGNKKTAVYIGLVVVYSSVAGFIFGLIV